MTECAGLVGGVLGHRFRGRYSEVVENGFPFAMLGRVNLTGEASVEVLKRLGGSTRTYHGDVCERCGAWRGVPVIAGEVGG